jgi:hypothetical protein
VQRKNGASQLGARRENAAQTAFLRGSFCCGVCLWGAIFANTTFTAFTTFFQSRCEKCRKTENTTFPPFSPFFSHVSKNVSGLGTPLLPHIERGT